MSAMKRKLTIHIGMGKTGSSSIQSTLCENGEKLDEKGIKYLGLMLEFAGEREFNWQKARGWNIFNSLSKEIMNKQLVHVFERLNNELPDKTSHLIWSNESLFGNAELLSTAISKLDEFFDVQVIGYIRRPDTWVLSAYLQWGIKHKTYKGPLKSFSQWIKNRKFSWEEDMMKWITLVQQAHYYNFDKVGNVTQHFLNIILPGKNDEIIQKRVYETPPPAIQALYAYYNSAFDSQVEPNDFNKILHKSGVDNLSQPVRYFNNYLPEKDDINNYVKKSMEHINRINEILVDMGEPELVIENFEMKDYTVKQQEIDRALLFMIAYLYKKLEMKNPD